jgi:SET domain-containing protein
MAPLSYRSPKTEVRPSSIHGKGLFAVADIARGEIVAVKGGHIISRAQLQQIAPELGPAEIQIGDGVYIAPVTAAEREGSMLYTNHSCEPNLGMRGEITFVAMRDIAPGEELTHDWAMTDDDDYALACNCGAVTCRGTLTGKDWQRRDLQKRRRNRDEKKTKSEAPKSERSLRGHRLPRINTDERPRLSSKAFL